MEVYRHIRYATAERFGDPIIAGFSTGTTTDSAPSACPQPHFRLGFLMGDTETMSMSEDCQFLNIWTPATDGKHPVFVWIHGGAYIAGSGEESAYDATAMCREGDIVVVTISYRLGIWGYLHNNEQGIENMGLKDQIAALRWVKSNIHRFGGDPENITVGGQSAGGHSVATIISTCDEPLFKKAIIQSAPLIKQKDSNAKAIYRLVCRTAQKPIGQMTIQEMLDVQKAVMESFGTMLPFAPVKADLTKGAATKSLKKVLVTWQKDDAAPFVAMKLKHQNNFGLLIDKIVTRIATKVVFANSARRYARILQKHGIETELHCLDWVPANTPFGACHCLELSLLFGNWERWKDARMLGNTSKSEWEKKGKETRQQWISFIKSEI